MRPAPTTAAITIPAMAPPVSSVFDDDDDETSCPDEVGATVGAADAGVLEVVGLRLGLLVLG